MESVRENLAFASGREPWRAGLLTFERHLRDRARDHEPLALLEKIVGLRHLRICRQQVGLDGDKFLEGGIDVLLRFGHRLAGREEGRHEQVGEPFGVLQRRKDDAALVFGIVGVGPRRRRRLHGGRIVGDAEPRLQVVHPHAVHVDGAGFQGGDVRHFGSRYLLQQTLADRRNHHGIIHLDDRKILFVLVLLHLFQVHQRSGALVDDLAGVLLLHHRRDDGLDEVLVAGCAADHEFLALGAQDARRGENGGGGPRHGEDRATLQGDGLWFFHEASPLEAKEARTVPMETYEP